MPIRVVIVEDDEKVRGGLAALIGCSAEFSCIATFKNAEEAMQAIPELQPDVVMMDIGLPGISGIECVRKLKAQYPRLQFLMQTVYEDDDRIFESLAAGASGYILKKTPPVKLLEAIQEIHNGGSPMSGQIARRVVETFQRPAPASDEMANLSDREMEILAHLAKGYRCKEIAGQLFISVETVRTHLRRIYEKLHVRSRTEAVLKYFHK